MEIRAGVIRDQGQTVNIETLQLDSCRPDEVIVEIVAVGICHTDIAFQQGLGPGFRWPAVLGHEGAGRIIAMGEAVTRFAIGDHVLASFASCGSCERCESHMPYRCANFLAENIGGRRQDGSETLRDNQGPINANFFGQSSFATHAIVREHNLVGVGRDLPLELLAPLGCGFQTGAGTVLNFMKPRTGSSMIIFGAGAVGMAALFAAKEAGCDPIILLDRIPERLAIAAELGATHVINVASQDAASEIGALLPQGGNYVIETSGSPRAMESAMAALGYEGLLVTLAMNAADQTITVPLDTLRRGRIEAVTEGAADPQHFILELIRLYEAGRFPIDRLVEFYSFEEINRAFHDAETGKVIKPVLLMNPHSKVPAPARL